MPGIVVFGSRVESLEGVKSLQWVVTGNCVSEIMGNQMALSRVKTSTFM